MDELWVVVVVVDSSFNDRVTTTEQLKEGVSEWDRLIKVLFVIIRS